MYHCRIIKHKLIAYEKDINRPGSEVILENTRPGPAPAYHHFVAYVIGLDVCTAGKRSSRTGDRVALVDIIVEDDMPGHTGCSEIGDVKRHRVQQPDFSRELIVNRCSDSLRLHVP